MSDKLDKILKGVKVGKAAGKLFLPKGIADVIEAVEQSIGDDGDPANAEAARALAAQVKSQGETIAKLTKAVEILYDELQTIKKKL